jgi:hypothetical protein
MASTKINFDTKELQFDLSQVSYLLDDGGESNVGKCSQWWRLVADMWRCSSVDDQRIHAMQCVHI